MKDKPQTIKATIASGFLDQYIEMLVPDLWNQAAPMKC